MTFTLIRILFLLISAVVGFQFGSQFGGFGTIYPFIGAAFGLGVAFFVIFIERGLGKVSLRGLSAAVFGLILALMVSRFLTDAIELVPELDRGVASSLKLAVVLVLCYLGMVFAMRGRDEFNLIIPYVKLERKD